MLLMAVLTLNQPAQVTDRTNGRPRHRGGQEGLPPKRP